MPGAWDAGSILGGSPAAAQPSGGDNMGLGIVLLALGIAVARKAA
jgi:hypothetical protein